MEGLSIYTYMLRHTFLLLAILQMVFCSYSHAQKKDNNDSIDVAAIMAKSPLTEIEGKQVIIGQIDGNGKNMFFKTLHWALQNICTKNFEGINELDKKKMQMSCNLAFPIKSKETETAGSCDFKATFVVKNNILHYVFSDFVIRSTVLIFTKAIPIEKLNPMKKRTHALFLESFFDSDRIYRNEFIKQLKAEKIMPITHMDEIVNYEVVTGMNEDECLFALGKPGLTSKNTKETQWVYNDSRYLIFTNGVLSIILD